MEWYACRLGTRNNIINVLYIYICKKDCSQSFGFLYPCFGHTISLHICPVGLDLWVLWLTKVVLLGRKPTTALEIQLS